MFKKLTCILLLSALTGSAFADIEVVNSTDSYGTARLGISPCSAAIGDSGVMKPHHSLNVPQSVIGLYCSFADCDAHIYLSKDCSGPELAKARVNVEKGVIGMENFDPEHFSIVGSGHHIVIVPVNKNKSSNWFSRFFS